MSCPPPRCGLGWRNSSCRRGFKSLVGFNICPKRGLKSVADDRTPVKMSPLDSPGSEQSRCSLRSDCKTSGKEKQRAFAVPKCDAIYTFRCGNMLSMKQLSRGKSSSKETLLYNILNLAFIYKKILICATFIFN